MPSGKAGNMNPYLQVKNMKNTSDNKVPDGYNSWKDYWEKKSGRRFEICSEKDCNSRAEHGAHVKIMSRTIIEALEITDKFGTDKCIVPLCDEHNNVNNTEAFFVATKNLVPIVK